MLMGPSVAGDFRFVRSFSVSTQTNVPRGVFLDSSGTRMYVGARSTERILQYSLSTAWNISTASYVRQLTVSTQISSVADIFFKPDGTSLFILDNSAPGEMAKYDLSTAWDISSATYASSLALPNFPLGLFFKPDGTKAYVTEAQTDTVIQYNLDSAWGTTSSSNSSFSLASESSAPYGTLFNSSGTKMYMWSGTRFLFEYDVGTAWDVTTASYTGRTILDDSAGGATAVASFMNSSTSLFFTVYGINPGAVRQFSR